MPSLPIVLVVTPIALLALASVIFLVYVWIQYSPIVARIFEEKPLFLPLRATPTHDGEEVRFSTRDKLTLAGTYLKARTPSRTGVLVFCHEFLSNRWSVLPYLDHLRDRGFDLLTFDFRNHGESDHDPKYSPMQWVTDHEIEDLRSAIAYLKSRSDTDPAGFGIFGVSRGGGSAICVAARERLAWGIVTDGAFPTRGTMVSYILRWAEIYVRSQWFWKIAPIALFEYLAWTGRMRTQWRTGRRYSDVEGATARLTPRPWLSIHGQKDAYIGVPIAQKLFDRAGDPKELWIVPGAKHNRCREKDPVAYSERLVQFFNRYAPRRPAQPEVKAPVSETTPTPLTGNPLGFDPLPLPTEVAVGLPV